MTRYSFVISGFIKETNKKDCEWHEKDSQEHIKWIEEDLINVLKDEFPKGYKFKPINAKVIKI